MLGSTCEYVSRVMAIERCLSISERSLGFTLRGSRSMAQVCPRSWKRMWGSRAFLGVEIRRPDGPGVRTYATWLEEFHFSGAGYSLGAASCPKLAVEPIDVCLDGARRDEEFGRDLLVG